MLKEAIIIVNLLSVTRCNIGSKTLLSEQGMLPLKFSCPAGTSACPVPLLNEVELHCEDSAQNISCRAGQVRVLICLPDCRFLPNSLATGQVVILHAV